MPSITARSRSGGNASPEPSSPVTINDLIASAACKLTELFWSTRETRAGLMGRSAPSPRGSRGDAPSLRASDLHAPPPSAG